MIIIETFINDIRLDYCTYIPREINFSVTDKSVQNTSSENITLHVKKNLTGFSITGSFTGQDREEKFQKLMNLALERDVVTIQQDREIDNLIITEVSEPRNFINTITFSVTFRQLTIIDFTQATIPIPSRAQNLQTETTEGLQNTETIVLPESKYPNKVGGPL